MTDWLNRMNVHMNEEYYVFKYSIVSLILSIQHIIQFIFFYYVVDDSLVVRFHTDWCSDIHSMMIHDYFLGDMLMTISSICSSA